MPTSPIRLNPALVAAAEREGQLQKRSTPKQIEFWADLGRTVERVIDLSDVFAVLQGLKRLKLEHVESVTVEPDDLFDHLEKQARRGMLSREVTTTSIYYEASKGHPGMLDRVNAATGRRQTGQFRSGRFVLLK